MLRIGRRALLTGVAALAAAPRVFAQAAGPIRIPFTLTDSRVLVDCTIAGRGPFRFVLDTGGAIGLLDARFVRDMGLRRVGESPLGLRGGRGVYPVHEALDIVFGGVVRQPSAAFAAVTGFNFGDGAVGSLAAGVLSAVNGELDYDAREWRIHATPPERAGWARYADAIVQHGNRNGSSFLFADTELGGAAFRFGLDTGMPTAVRIYRRTAERAGLWDAPRWSPAGPDGRTRIVRAARLGLAGATIPNPLISIMESPQWAPFQAGLLGLPILRQFNMATEAAASALLLKRNGQPPAAERYNLAGLWLDGDGGRISVGVVGRGSPAEAAGLTAGDRLVDADFEGLIAAFRGSAGTQIPLISERAGVRRSLTLTLTDYL